MTTAPRTRRLFPGTAILGLLFLLVPATPASGQHPEPPPPLPERPIEFPGFEEFTLDNGLRVVVVSYGTQPVMSARLYVPGGSAAEPGELAGLASMSATVLTKGTATRSATEISETIEGVGGSLSASADRDFFSVSVTTLTDHIGTGFELLADVVKDATFPEDEVELARRQQLSSLQAQLGQPQTIATRRFSSVVYGVGHPYGTDPTPETVRAISRDDLAGFRDSVLRPAGALLLVAGRVDRDDVEGLARRHLGEWEGEAPPAAAVPDPPDRDRAGIYLVHRPGSVQSTLAIGHLGVEPDNPDYFALVVMNRVLGGGADSRLFRILREEKGWTYGAYSDFTRSARRGNFRAVSEVRTEVTDSTVTEILAQMDRLRTEPVPDEEMDAARNYLAGSFPLRLETASQVAGQLATTLLLGLPIEDLTRYPERIRAVTGEDVREAARRYLHPDRAAIVVVGDAPQILADLEPIAPVTLFDVEGNPLDREEVLSEREPGVWDAGRLEPGLRRYEVFVQDQPMGAVEFRLEREGDDWVSTQTQTVAAMGYSEETRLRFSADDMTPRSLEQSMSQGAIRVSANLVIEDGVLTGKVELPEQMGGDREFDEELPPGTLLPGMEAYAVTIADLEEDTRLTIPYLNVIAGNVVTLEARVRGREEISVSAGTFDTWRVELTGGQAPTTLYLAVEAPHMVIRQVPGPQPVRIDLTGYSPL